MLDRLMDQVPDPIFVYDAQGRHAYVNSAGEKLLGLCQEDWAQKTWEEMGLPEPVAQSMRSWSQPVFSSRSSLMMELTLPTVDGIRIFECLLNPLQGNASETLAVNCLRDITDRKRIENEAKSTLLRESQARRQAERAWRQSKKLLLVTSALSDAQTASEVVEAILGQAITALDGHAGSVVMLSESGTHLEHLGSIGMANALLQLHQAISVETDFPLPRAVRTQAPVWIESEYALVSDFPEFAALISKSETRAMAALPLIVEGKPIGALSLRFRDNRVFMQDERTFILTLAGQCAQALERVRCNEKEKARKS
jgi:PAS domain S-box-containing protein